MHTNTQLIQLEYEYTLYTGGVLPHLWHSLWAMWEIYVTTTCCNLFTVNPVRVSPAATTAISRVTVCNTPRSATMAVANDTNTKLAGAEVPQHLYQQVPEVHWPSQPHNSPQVVLLLACVYCGRKSILTQQRTGAFTLIQSKTCSAPCHVSAFLNVLSGIFPWVSLGQLCLCSCSVSAVCTARLFFHCSLHECGRPSAWNDWFSYRISPRRNPPSHLAFWALIATGQVSLSPARWCVWMNMLGD